MATTSEARALPFFTDLYGSPLESGSIYIGQAGLDPIAYPATVTSDAAGTIIVAQPIRTTHGHAAAAGALIHLFCQIPYSITILDGAGRLVYASLNETDPVATALGTSSVQSAATLNDLRARDKNNTNLVWVDQFGMYVYQATDNISPENLPMVVVGFDGARYHLSLHYVNAVWAKVSGGPAQANTQGGWLSWNDDGTGSTYLTNNRGVGVGGIVFRNVNAAATVELGRVTMTSTGGLTTSDLIITAGGVVATTGDIKATAGNVIAGGGTVAVTPDGARGLVWNSGSGTYNLVSAPLNINGSLAITQAGLATNQLANAIGSVALGNNIGPNPAQPGSWTATGTSFNTVFLWVRTA